MNETAALSEDRKGEALGTDLASTPDTTMDRLIWVTWRAFWVGLGASAVLITQTLIAPAPAASRPVPAVEVGPGQHPAGADRPLSSSAERGGRERTHS